MSGIIEERLIFWPFFEKLEKELSYERWMDKYRLFRQALASGAIPYDDNWHSFRQFCKFLYLQDHTDEVRFNELLDEAIAEEKAQLLAYWQHALQDDTPTSDQVIPEPPEEKETEPPKPATRPSLTSASDQSRTVPPPEPATETKYFHPKVDMEWPDINEESGKTPLLTRYLHTDEYFPTNRRELVKSWQYLRRKERAGASDRINIPNTVLSIARDGVFVKPEYDISYLNRQDVLFLFADSRGSMSPFHELSRRLIETAKGEGGHRRAPTYFFQNAPLEYLYRAPNLTDPVSMKGAMQRANRNVSYAFIISDAGAARGNTNADQIDRRLRQLRPFLQLLQAHMAHVIWLNPMPKHRWAGTAAGIIASEPSLTAMVPVLEEGEFNYQDVIRRIIKARSM